MFNSTVRKCSETRGHVRVASPAVVPFAACISDYESQGGVMSRRVLYAYVLSLCCVLSVFAQQSSPAGSADTVPPLVNFSGELTPADGGPATGMVGITFLLYKESQGGVPLWMETQNVQPDKNGHYSVMLGSTSSRGLPAEIFAAGEARWLGVQAEGQSEQPRVLLLSVPYALKAADAQTVGGLPPSAFKA